MNKSGKGWPVIVWVVLAIVLVYLLVPGVQTGINNFFKGGEVSKGEVNINTVNPYITVTSLDKGAPGTTVSVSAYGSFDSGGFKSVSLGSDTAVPGQTLSLLLVNNTLYHNAKVDPFKVESTSFPVTVYLNKNASVTENIYNTVGLVMTNGGGATNQTALGNGATYNFKDSMSGTSLASTQDMICVVEVEEGANVSTTAGVTYDGKAPISTAKPSWYTLLGSGSNVYLFEVPALDSGAEVTRNLQIVNSATKCFSPLKSVKKTCYTKEYFIDSNSGKIVYDVADSDGNLKSMAQYSYRFYFV